MMKQITLLSSLMAVAMASSVFAGISTDKNPVGKNPITEPNKEQSIYDKIWDLPTLYKNKNNPFLQEFSIIGRYQTQYTYTDADEGNFDDWETRRCRLGIKAKLLKQLELKLDWNIAGIDDEDFDPKFDSIDSLSLIWEPTDEFSLKIGKYKPIYTAEYRTPANELIVFERSIATAAVIGSANPWGVSAVGKIGQFSYQAGVHATQLDGEYDEWFASDSDLLTVIGVGYDFGGKDKVFSKAQLAAQYAHTEEFGKVTPKFSDVMAVNFLGNVGDFGILADVIAGFDGSKGGNMFGFVIAPSYDITKQLQAVARYSYANGDDDTIGLRSRYEGSVTKGAGDEAHSIYAGLNYYIYGQKLKLMSGVEYLTVNDSASNGGEYDGYTLFAGLRMFF